MDAQELKPSYRGNKQRVESVQMSTHGPYISARYVNTLSRLNGSYQGDVHQILAHGQTVPLPRPEGPEDVASSQMQMSSEQSNVRKHHDGPADIQHGPKRRKEDGVFGAGNDGCLQLLPSHADQRQSSNAQFFSAAQVSMQQAFLQHAQQLPVQLGSSDASMGLSGEPTNTSPSRLTTEAASVMEATHCPSSVHYSSLRLCLEGSPRSFFHNSPSPGNVNGSSQLSHPASIQEPILVPDMSSSRLSVKEWGNKPLSSVDPHLFSIIQREKVRQWKGIELIASENFTSQAVMDVLGSHLINKYSEGLPGARYYGGNEYIDQIESLCRERALLAFHLDPESWGVNVQPYSCTSANLAVYTALLQPKDRIMGLDSPSGGHLSHGYYTSGGKKVAAASIFFENLPYKVNPETGYIDYEKLEEKALDYRPKILICGGSAYPREWDYAKFRQIADKVGAILMCDMAHISGLVAAQECANPFDFCDIVTSTTHKSMRGPRGGMIFYRKSPKRRSNTNGAEGMEQFDYEDRVNFAVFPSLQGGPHNNQVGALAVALKQVATPEFKAYIQQVKKNAQALAVALQRRGGKLVTDGTDNHLLLWDLRSHGLTGFRFEKICELCHITLNKNAVYGDSGTYAPGGVRIGTPAMTSRGCVESDFETIAEFLFRALQIGLGVQREQGKATNKDFLRSLQASKDAEDLRLSVEKFASSLEMPGFDPSILKFN